MIRGTGEKNLLAEYHQIWFTGYSLEQQQGVFPIIEEGVWCYIEHNGLELHAFFPEGDERKPMDSTDYLVIEIPVGRNRTLDFVGNVYGGIAEIIMYEHRYDYDTYLDTIDITSNLKVELPDSFEILLGKNAIKQLIPYFSLFLPLGTAYFLMIGLLFKSEKYSKIRNYQFLFEELVKRDFSAKYKRTVLGIFWSVLSPLLTLIVMYCVLGNFFGAGIDHYLVYLFCGQLVFNYFTEATNLGMGALMENSGIITKVNVPKYLFVFSKNVASLISFLMTFFVLLAFVLFDGLTITPQFLCLIYPMGCLMLFNIGMGLILSAVYLFFRDTHYLWNIFTLLLMYMSAVFYNVSGFDPEVQHLFYYNPIYTLILYFRQVMIEGSVPELWHHFLLAGNTLLSLFFGLFMYKKYNHEFLYYV